MLSECRLRHLLQSRVFKEHFQVEGAEERQEEEEKLIENFFIIEENSMFCISEKGARSKIVVSTRKIRHIRRLSEFEVCMLIMKSVGHLMVSGNNSAA